MDRSDVMGAVGARSVARQDLVEMTMSLIAEFADVLPAGTVIRCVARVWDQLLGAGVRAGLVVAAESTARLRLSELLPAPRRLR